MIFKIKIHKALMLVIISTLIIAIFSGCYDKREIDDLAFAIVLGIDKGQDKLMRMTIQFASTSGSSQSGGASGGGSSEGSSESGEHDKNIITIEAPTIYEGISMINGFVSKQVTLSHIKAIIFSEEIAKEGVGDYLNSIVRYREFRPDMYVAVSKSKAEDYIKSVKPLLTSSISKYYELKYGVTYTGFVPNTQLHEFYDAVESCSREAVTTLAAPGKNKKDEETEKLQESSQSDLKNKRREYSLAGNIPKSGVSSGEIMGMAMFKGHKLVGEADGEETAYYLMAMGRYNYAYWSVPDPRHHNNIVALNILQRSKSIRKVKIVNGVPYISLFVKLEADFMAIESGENYERDVKAIEDSTEDFIKKGVELFLNRTSKEVNSDICGFGSDIKKKTLTMDRWEQLDWKRLYENALFDVHVDVKIRRPGIILRTLSKY